MTKLAPVLPSLLLLTFFATASRAEQRPIPVRVVIVTMFEIGADTGDSPGELQYWAERDHLDRIYPVPAAYHPVRMNDKGEMAVLTGRGTAHAAAAIMAVGLDPQFDFSHAYWIIAGIAGGCPDQVSLGSAVWARWVVDGDLGYEIDAREIPGDWPTGYLPFRKKLPFEKPAEPEAGQVYALNLSFAQWAFQLTRRIPLEDSDKLMQIRAHFDGAAAARPPFVALGDEISSSTFWHGDLLDKWAARWVPYFTGDKGVFATTAMEDTGTLQSLEFLAHAGRVDTNRILVLRAVSNYDRQPRGVSAAESLASQRVGEYGAYLPALEASYTVGHTVVEELLSHWSRYESTVPGWEEISPKNK
jgi:purine nucleoside permease